MNCLELLFWYLNHTPMDDLLHTVVSNILKNVHAAQRLNIYELADVCYTSPATISRLVKKLGFKSYAYFQKSLADALSQYQHHNRHLPLDEMHGRIDLMPQLIDTVQAMIQEFKQTYSEQDFAKAAQMLKDSNRVVLYSAGSSVESSLQSDLVVSGIPCELVDEVTGEAALSHLDARGTALFLSAKRIDTTAIERAVAIAKTRGAKIIVITDTQYFSILKDADIAFVFKGKLHLVDVYLFDMHIVALDMKYREMFMD